MMSMIPKAVIDIEDLLSAVHSCSRLTHASRENVQAAIQTKLREPRCTGQSKVTDTKLTVATSVCRV
jgi:hypothetical protein